MRPRCPWGAAICQTDATFVGFRVVRPLVEPPEEERSRYWEPDLDSIREIMERQRTGAR